MVSSQKQPFNHCVSLNLQVARTDVTSYISFTASSLWQFLSYFSLSLFIPPSPPDFSHPLPPLCISSPPVSHFSPSWLQIFFFCCSFSHTPSCCSKSLKGTELVSAVAMVTEGWQYQLWGWV